ncbi:hypothetical protein ACVWZ6_003742 [Bradyrhizobium sp. GM6.1]
MTDHDRGREALRQCRFGGREGERDRDSVVRHDDIDAERLTYRRRQIDFGDRQCGTPQCRAGVDVHDALQRNPDS